jgi:hypothetical protein
MAFMLIVVVWVCIGFIGGNDNIGNSQVLYCCISFLAAYLKFIVVFDL